MAGVVRGQCFFTVAIPYEIALVLKMDCHGGLNLIRLEDCASRDSGCANSVYYRLYILTPYS